MQKLEPPEIGGPVHLEYA